MSEVFEQMVKHADRSGMPTIDSISNEQYESWKQEFSWDALKGLRYGQSFCNSFGVNDNILFYTRDVNECDRYIKNTYLSK